AASAAATAARSVTSARTKVKRGSEATSFRLSRLPAYVRLSKTTTRAAVRARARRTKFDPMNPAPPVTRSVCMPATILRRTYGANLLRHTSLLGRGDWATVFGTGGAPMADIVLGIG